MWQDKTDQKGDLKHSWNVESQIEHIRENVVWEMSC